MNQVLSYSPALHTATFAGGCFWCLNPVFDAEPGVLSTQVGYAGGHSEHPTYEAVYGEMTGHREAIQVTYDSERVLYQRLVEIFFQQIDPTDEGGQFADRGQSYTTAVWYQNDAEKKTAESVVSTINASQKFSVPVVTEILPYTNFYPAEERHQDYYQKAPVHYNLYKKGSGRADFIDKNWGPEEEEKAIDKEVEYAEKYKKPSREYLSKMLTPHEFDVTQGEGTEPPFDNEYCDNHKDGIYVDRVTGEPLFSSRDKFDSGTGWPSFDRPINPHFVTQKTDNRLFSSRTEIRSKYGESHLGHLFDDGPRETTGQRYCMNSAALRFIPIGEMKQAGYEEYISKI